jgi:hypothetical protein
VLAGVSVVWLSGELAAVNVPLAALRIGAEKDHGHWVWDSRTAQLGALANIATNNAAASGPRLSVGVGLLFGGLELVVCVVAFLKYAITISLVFRALYR